jgi:hypothetical protein
MHGAHTAARNLAGEEVALAPAGAVAEEVLDGRLTRLRRGHGLVQGDTRINAGPVQAADRTVEVLGRFVGFRPFNDGHHEWLFARRAPGRPAGKLRLDLELHAALRTGKGDHRWLSVGKTLRQPALVPSLFLIGSH